MRFPRLIRGSILVIRANGEVVKERFADDPARRSGLLL